MSDVTDQEPFPAEADLAAVAETPLGSAGRYRLVGGTNGTAAFMVDTLNGRSWKLDGDRWTPLRYDVVPPDPAP